MSLNSSKIYANRFVLKNKLSQGSFGIVYQVHDRTTNSEFALKVELEQNQKKKTLEREVTMLIQLENIQGVPQLIYHGSDCQTQFIVMELLGKDLSFYLKQYKKFSFKCCLQVAYDCIDILKNIHKRFILHRDLKPENIVMSIELDQIYIIDFGVSKIYFEADHIPFREDKDFIGTVRYASIAAHKGQELGRKDDLESLFYVIFYFLRGQLPWQNIPVESCERNRVVGNIKQTISIQELASIKCPELIKIFQYIRKLKFQEQPDYEFIKDLLIEAAKAKNIHLDGYYDWTEGIKFSKKLSESKVSFDKKEFQSSKQQMKSTTKISNYVIWSLCDNSIAKSQQNLQILPDKKKRCDIHHFSSGSNISAIMGTKNQMKLMYLPQTLTKKDVGIQRMISIEILAHDESVYSEQIDENFQESPLNDKYKDYVNEICFYNKFIKVFEIIQLQNNGCLLYSLFSVSFSDRSGRYLLHWNKYEMHRQQIHIYNFEYAVELLICLGCLMAIVNCQVSWSFIFIGLSGICVWQSFTMYATSTNKVIIWNAAQKTMIIMGYIVPLVFYLISLLVMRNTEFHYNSQICAIKFNSSEMILSKVLQFFFFFAFQLTFLIFGIIDSIKQKSRFTFLEQSYRETLFLPIITSVLILSYFISFNIQYWLEVQQIIIINNICSILMEIDLIILVFQYGFNPTILKVNAVRKVYQFRQNLELKYRNKLLEGSGSTFFHGTYSESELGSIEQIQSNFNQ
ncbi:unnamed protein product [Paramecium sonneborni]|uniref:Casein kinase I n=1 Tax=Paramecium sonneborni TaxID=65129 RepID=A0A8S1LWN1_9CILI|nr:unnamed protein product [Paramecium sonneborni]